jgi:hypothetical protein
MEQHLRDQLEEAWQQQQRWSRTAGRLKSRIGASRIAALTLTLTGAALAATATQLSVDAASAAAARTAAVAAAFAVGLVPTLRVVFDRGMVSDWTRMRAISEALKSEVLTCLAGVSPYRGPDRPEVLAGNVRKVLRDGEDLAHHLPAALPAAAPLPGVWDVASYVQVRLIGQIDRYYRPKAREMNHRLIVARNVQAALAVTGAALGVLVLVPDVHSVAWIGVVTTAATAVAAYAAESRYLYQFIEYSRTVQQLDSLLDGYQQAPGGRTAASDDDLVAQCERVISIQNEGWMVKWRTE